MFLFHAADLVATLVARPEDTLPLVHASIGEFKEALLHILEDEMARMDQAYLLELDANLSPTVLRAQLLLRLESYAGVRKAFRAMRLSEAAAAAAAGGEAAEETEAGETLAFVDSAEVGLLSFQALVFSSWQVFFAVEQF